MTKEQTDNILKQIKLTHQSKAMHRAPVHTTIDWLIKRVDELELRLEIANSILTKTIEDKSYAKR